MPKAESDTDKLIRKGTFFVVVFIFCSFCHQSIKSGLQAADYCFQNDTYKCKTLLSVRSWLGIRRLRFDFAGSYGYHYGNG